MTLRCRYTTPEESFRARTKVDGECLIWIGATKPDGYGLIRVDGKTVRVHRWAYEQSKGVIPEGLVIDHMCHNRSCVEVDHLRVVTTKQNTENPGGLQTNNKSGHINVSWDSRTRRWAVRLVHNREAIFGGRYPPHELHVAAHYARKLREKYFTPNPYKESN